MLAYCYFFSFLQIYKQVEGVTLKPRVTSLSGIYPLVA